VEVADHRDLPLPDDSADVVISGWSIGYFVGWSGRTWLDDVRATLAEMVRVARGGGTLVILETLGTGFESPTPPPELIPYYEFLEAHGFTSTWIRTDYKFESLAEAESLTRFFFGGEMAEKVLGNNWMVLPECTGIWWMRV
jgi:ubiquinone/menaquinone biosynthesis C-methylase UbiE